MEYLFVIQGEGRGHFTQALSLKSMLERNGHTVVAIMVGCSAQRALPGFIIDITNTEVIRFQSPNFLPSPKGKKSFLLASILYNLLLVPTYIASLFKIKRTISKKQPDIVVNFYELLCGITYGVFNPKVPMINVAHQYYFLTPDFNYTGKNVLQFKLLNFYSRLTALNASKILALSFRAKESSLNKDITIVPPLLRQEVLRQKSTIGNYIHGYLLNSGYVTELIKWSEFNLYERLHFFWDKRNVDESVNLTYLLTMHTLDDKLFLEYMAGAKAYATTGGFESVCEAMYLQKPVLMVPTHIEQECNVIDAMKSGAGVSANGFDLNLLLNFIPTYNGFNEFKYWVQTGEYIFLQELTQQEYVQSNIYAAL